MFADHFLHCAGTTSYLSLFKKPYQKGYGNIGPFILTLKKKKLVPLVKPNKKFFYIIKKRFSPEKDVAKNREKKYFSTRWTFVSNFLKFFMIHKTTFFHRRSEQFLKENTISMMNYN